MADGSITVEVSTQAAHAELQRLKAENAVLAEQVRALWHALAKVLDAGSHERKAHERAMLAASDAEREAHVLLATLKRLGA